jgi:hypothetical protein
MFKLLYKQNYNLNYDKKNILLPKFVREFDNRKYNHIIIYNPINEKKEIFILK